MNSIARGNIYAFLLSALSMRALAPMKPKIRVLSQGWTLAVPTVFDAINPLSAFAILLIGFPQVSQAASLTYEFNHSLSSSGLNLSPGNARGTITTDGSLGTFSFDTDGSNLSFFKDWNIVLTVNQYSYTLTPANSFWDLVRLTVRATPTELTFDLTPNPDTGDAGYQLQWQGKAVYFWANVPENSFPIQEVIYLQPPEAPLQAAANISAPISYSFPSIHSSTPVPEPTTLLGASLALGGGGLFKRKLSKKRAQA